MTDLASGVDQALYDALSAVVTLGTVFQNPPEDTLPPVVIIAEATIEPIGAKGDPLDRIEQTILTVVAGKQKKAVRALQEQVRTALDNQTLSAAGLAPMMPVELSCDDQRVIENGKTYYLGTQRFLIFAQPG